MHFPALSIDLFTGHLYQFMLTTVQKPLEKLYLLKFLHNPSKGIVLDWFEDLKITNIFTKKIILLSSKGGLATTTTTT